MNFLLILWNALLVAGLIVVCIGAGLTIIRRLRPQFTALESVTLALGLGMGLVGTSVFGLGLAKGLSSAGLALLFVAWTAVGWAALRDLPGLAGRALGELTDGWDGLSYTVLVLLAGLMLTNAALPPIDFDSLVYHLPLPTMFLEAGRIFLPPDNPHAAYLGLMHMLYIPLLAAGSPSAPAMLSVMITLGLVPVAVLIGRRFFSDRTSQIAIVLWWGGPVLFFVGVTPRVDVTLVWYLLLGQYVAMRVYQKPERRCLPWLAGGLLGLAVAVKLNAVIFVVALSSVLFAALWLKHPSRFPRLGMLGAFLAAFVISVGPWFLKSWAWYGFPLYPAFVGLAPAESIQLLYPQGAVPGMPGQLHPQAQVRDPFSIIDFFFAPHRITPERFMFGNPALLLLPLWLIRPKGWAKMLILAPALLYAALVLARGQFINVRYFLPTVVPLTFIVAAALADLLPIRIQRPLILALVVPSFFVMAARTAAVPAWEFASGRMSSAEYVERLSTGEINSLINEKVTGDARVLMLFEARSYGIGPRTIPDQSLTNWMHVAPAGEASCLANSRITHILVNDRQIEYFLGRGLEPESVRWDDFPAFEQRCLQLIGAGDSFRLYRIRPAGSGA